ncbi:4Fe-4S binding protein [bacterium]|nr:4Fe-4S binding protein [bacterium]
MSDYLKNGYLTLEDISPPDMERLEKGPVAVIECVQEIPCNPCSDSCHRGAITMKTSINDRPDIDYKLCNGCGICVANCPGLAIFLIDQSYSETEALVGLPYEFLPLPEAGEKVMLLSRQGEVCGEGVVQKVRNTRAMDRTPIVFISMRKDLAMTVRFFRR